MYGQYVLNNNFHCYTYCEIHEYFNSKTQLKSFIETVISHNDKYYIYNLVDEFYNKEYCEKYKSNNNNNGKVQKVDNMKFVYMYSNCSCCYIDSISEFDLFDKEEYEGLIFHSKEVSNKTINKEKEDNNILHIFKKHKDNGISVWRWYASYCV